MVKLFQTIILGESSYGKDLSDYHSKIKIIKNFNGRSLKLERFKS